MLQEAYSSESSDNEEEYLEEDTPEEEQFFCLFCDMVLTSTESLMGHSQKSHKVDLVSALGQLSFYGAIKTINYTRAKPCSVGEFNEVLQRAEELEDEFMKPYRSDDSLLMIDFEELFRGNNPASSSNGDFSSAKVEFLQGQLEKLQQAYMDLVERSRNNIVPAPPKPDHYFESYANYTIHAEMLEDKVRTEAYRDYIYNNKAIFDGKDVLDVGCGTGILSMFCAAGGAGSVVAVDNSKIVQKAKSIVKSNNLSSKINVFEGKVEEISLDRKFDILISEWMGYGLLFECMLDSIIIARDKYLKPGGHVVPNRASMFITAVSDEASYHKRFSYWNNVYGFSMSEIIPDLYNEAVVEVVGKDHIISNHCGFKHLDICTVKVSELEFSRPFQLEINTSTTFTSLLVHFTCFFDGEFSTVLETSPESPTTHWLQTSLYLKCPVAVCEGDVISGLIEFNKNSNVKRGYIIRLDGVVKRENSEIAKFDQQFYLH